MIEIEIDGKDPREAILEVLRAMHIDGQSVRIVSRASSAAHMIACGAEAVASDIRRTIFEEWMDSRRRTLRRGSRVTLDPIRGLVPTQAIVDEPRIIVRHDITARGAARVEKARRKAERPRWRQ